MSSAHRRDKIASDALAPSKPEKMVASAFSPAEMSFLMADIKRHTPKDEPNEICPLCGASEAGLYLHADMRGTISHCPVCRLIFVPPEFWPAPDTGEVEIRGAPEFRPQMKTTSPFFVS